MKKSKLLLIPAIAAALLSLTACEYVTKMFNDDDLAYSNHYNPPVSTPKEDPNAVKAGGVAAKDKEGLPDIYCFSSIGYAVDETIVNTYKNGGVNHKEYNVNGGEDYYGNKSKNNFDLYVPKNLNKDEKQTVVLFIHGGAWISGFKTDVNEYVHEFARRGYITATIKYTLLKKEMDDPSLSIFRNLDEIDMCVSAIKSALDDLGFDTELSHNKINFVIGGASSGSHLAMLYSYSRGSAAALPIKLIIDAVGPVDMKPDNWKRFNNSSDEVLNAGITYSAIQTQRDAGNVGELSIAAAGMNFPWNDFQTMRIANGMCGLPFTLEEIAATTDSNKEEIVHPNDASNSLLAVGGGEDQVSVTYWMKDTNKIPMICAYSGKDTVVGIAQYATLQKKLIDIGNTDYDFIYFKNSGHQDMAEKDPEAYSEFMTTIENRLKAL